jgi:hypothetical protein
VTSAMRRAVLVKRGGESMNLRSAV